MKLDILVLAAHPDDTELGCGGTVAKHIHDGYSVGIVDLTRGELGTRGTPEIRAAEAADAARILGVSVRDNLGLRDGFFQNDPEHQLSVIAAIRKYRPSIVLANAVYDRHVDHGKGRRWHMMPVSFPVWLRSRRGMNTVSCRTRGVQRLFIITSRVIS